MATYQNPFLYGFSPWPFEDEDLTTTGTTAGGITDAYIGGGGDGGAGGAIPILPRDDERDDYDWLNKIPAGDPAGTPILGYGGQRRKHGPETAALSIPNFSEIANTMLGREGATEAFAGGAGNVGSRAGLYPNEVANLNTVMQGGYLNANNTGQDIFGVNVVSAGGDYAKRQQEIKDYYDSKSEEELEKLMKSTYHRGRRTNATNVVNANSAIVAAEKAATGFITKKDEREEKEEDKRKTRQMPTVPAGGIEGGVWWPGQPTTDTVETIPVDQTWLYSDTAQDVKDEIAAEQAIRQRNELAAQREHDRLQREVTRQAEAEAERRRKEEAARPPPEQHGGGGGGRDYGHQETRSSSGWESSPFAQGGRVRYGNGGIVDLL